MKDETNKMIDTLILSGAVEVAAIHEETGEFLYSFTPELEKIDPELSSQITNHFYSVVMSLWEKGFLNITFHEEDPNVFLTDKATEGFEDTLSDMEVMVLRNIIKNFERNE